MLKSNIKCRKCSINIRQPVRHLVGAKKGRRKKKIVFLTLGMEQKKGKVLFSTLNFHECPIFNLELQNQTSCTLELTKPGKFTP